MILYKQLMLAILLICALSPIGIGQESFDHIVEGMHDWEDEQEASSFDAQKDIVLKYVGTPEVSIPKKLLADTETTFKIRQVVLAKNNTNSPFAFRISRFSSMTDKGVKENSKFITIAPGQQRKFGVVHVREETYSKENAGKKRYVARIRVGSLKTRVVRRKFEVVAPKSQSFAIFGDAGEEARKVQEAAEKDFEAIQNLNEEADKESDEAKERLKDSQKSKNKIESMRREADKNVRVIFSVNSAIQSLVNGFSKCKDHAKSANEFAKEASAEEKEIVGHQEEARSNLGEVRKTESALRGLTKKLSKVEGDASKDAADCARAADRAEALVADGKLTEARRELNRARKHRDAIKRDLRVAKSLGVDLKRQVAKSQKAGESIAKAEDDSNESLEKIKNLRDDINDENKEAKKCVKKKPITSDSFGSVEEELPLSQLGDDTDGPDVSQVFLRVRLATEGDGTLRVNGRSSGQILLSPRKRLLRGLASPLEGAKFRKWTYTGPNGQETTISGAIQLTFAPRTGGLLKAVFVEE